MRLKGRELAVQQWIYTPRTRLLKQSTKLESIQKQSIKQPGSTQNHWIQNLSAYLKLSYQA